MIVQRYEALEENAASNGICLGQPLVLRDDNAEEVFCVFVMIQKYFLFLRRQVIDKLLSNKMTRIVVVFADRTQVGAIVILWKNSGRFVLVSVTRSLLIEIR